MRVSYESAKFKQHYGFQGHLVAQKPSGKSILSDLHVGNRVEVDTDLLEPVAKKKTAADMTLERTSRHLKQELLISVGVIIPTLDLKIITLQDAECHGQSVDMFAAFKIYSLEASQVVYHCGELTTKTVQIWAEAQDALRRNEGLDEERMEHWLNLQRYYTRCFMRFRLQLFVLSGGRHFTLLAIETLGGGKAN